MAMTTKPDADYALDPRFVAGVDMLRRTGSKDFRIGWSDEDDGPPTVWYAVATWPRSGLVSDRGEAIRGECAAAFDPVEAVMRLCERVIDGGTCTHCGQRTIFDPEPPTGGVVDDLLDAMGCRYVWNAESASFLRSCEKSDGTQAAART